MARIHRCFVLLLVFAAVAASRVPAAAQQGPDPSARPAASDDALAGARRAVAERKWQEAWDQLRELPPSEPALGLQVDVALALDRPSDAIRAWEQLRNAGGGRDALLQIGRYAARQLLESTDPLIRVETDRLLASVGEADARTRLRGVVDATAEAPVLRAGAAAALAAAGETGALARFEALARGLSDRDRSGLVRLLAGVPDPLALTLLAPMLKSGQSDIRYTAVLALGERPGPETARLLREFLASAPQGAARLAAMLVLAAQGDRTMLAEAGKVAPYFGDRERLAYARALQAAGDPQADRYIGLVQAGDNELLRLEAAALLARSSPATGRDLLIGALGSPTVWVRVRALELLRDLRPEPKTFAYLLTAPEDWIRLRATELALGSAGAQPATPRARP